MEVEVFRTNVCTAAEASEVIEQIHASFPRYKANFDLDDCDHILRVESPPGEMEAVSLVRLLNKSGFEAVVLPDDIPELLQF